MAKDDDKEKAPWKEQRVSAPAGLVAMLVTAVISAGGVKIADNAWPTEVEVRLAKIEMYQTEVRQIVGFLAAHHIKTGTTVAPPPSILALPGVNPDAPDDTP